MLLLAARDLSRQFDTEPVFRGVSFEVRMGEKIGLVGPNGCGKTTLLHLLAGLDEPDVGSVERHPAAVVSLLEQQPRFPPERTLREEVQAGLASLYRLQAEAQELADRLSRAAGSEELERLQRRYDELHQQLDRLDAYHVEHRVEAVLQGLGFDPAESDRRLHTFSGGQQNRAVLGRLLLAQPDVMLLDEPTNHLDIAATEWLEEHLRNAPQAVIVVSHDRYFLDRLTSRTLEMFGGGVHDYPGNFSAYWDLRQERHKVLRRTWEKQQEFVERTKDFIARNAYGQKHAQAKDREKKLERIELVEVPRDFDLPPISFPEPTRTGDWVFRAEAISKSFTGAPLFTGLTLQVDRGDRLGIFGPNGSGKTTLLRVLLGDMAPTTGHVARGTGVRIGYFDQQLFEIADDATAVEAVRPPDDPGLTPGRLRGLLARFGIRGELALQRVGAMSGGEKTRVALARLAAASPNVLVLDEPTNHLDFWSAAALEDALRTFSGTVLFVSHDRYFLDRVATRVLVLGPAGHALYDGNYSESQDFTRNRTADRTGGGDDGGSKRNAGQRSGRAEREQADSTPRKRRFPYRKVEEIEAEIVETEELVAALHARLIDPCVLRDGERVRLTRQELESAEARLAGLVEHWEEALELN